MGKEAQVQAILPDGPDAGRLSYEPPRLIFRGRDRHVFTGEALAGLRAEAGDLVLADGSRFTLSERAAASWVEAVLRPKGRLDKLGVKPGQRVAVVNLDDPGFLAELATRGAALVEPSGDLDLLFLGAKASADLVVLTGLTGNLAARGAVWVVFPKGRGGALKDVAVMAAVKALGLNDNKVCAFSDSLTALRFAPRR